jgi:hypothetical protein
MLISLSIGLRAENIEKTYFFSNPNISQKGEYQQINFQDMMLTAKAGDPALAYYAVSLLLPPGHEAIEIEFIGEDLVNLKGNFKICPYQPSRPLSETKKAKFYFNEDVYSSKNIFPKTQNGNLSTNYMNGYGFAFSSFTPMQYNPAEGSVSYFSKVTIRIKTAPKRVASEALKNLSSSEIITNSVVSLAQNPKAISLYPIKKIRSDDAYKLLIITPQEFENDFAGLRDIYLSRGMKSMVFTKEYIGQNIEGQDLQEKIRNLIIQEYQNSGVEYVVLGGDVEHIPYRGFYSYVVSGDGYTEYGIPADLYYSGLDGNWNDNGDDKWGEPDEDDLLPDIAVARMPFSTSTELANMINKSISYQNSPVLGEFRKPFLAGENLYSGPDTWGKDYLDLLIGTHDDNGYTTIGFPEDYNYETMYEFDASWGGSDLIAKINEGQQFVHHVGHASPQYVAHLNFSDITNSNFSGANGIDHNFTIMQTHGCDCGSFDASDCILEKMVTIENFATAVVGNSRYGWFNEGQTEGPAAHIHREMMDAFFNDKIAQIGRAFVECKVKTAPWVEASGQHEEGALRWNFYDLNVLGDPAMSVWNDEPIDIDVDFPSEIMLGTPTIDVTITSAGTARENFSCAIINNGELLATAMSNENGLAQITFNPVVTEVGEVELIVSGYNCLPDTNIITFIPAEGPYVVFNETVVNDASGNNNGNIDFGESILLNLSLENVGVQDALNVEAILSSENTEITLSDTEETYGSIPASQIVNIDGAFAFDVASNIPDQTKINFSVATTDGSQNWTSEFELTVNAPVLNAGNIVIDDSQNGNNNGMPDPGEVVVIKIPVTNNGHSNSLSSSATLSSTNSYVSFSQATFDLGIINVGDETMSSFEMTVDADAPVGTSLILNMEVNTGDYSFNNQYAFSIGLLIEDFETGDFSAFEWVNAGINAWTIVTENVFEGEYSAKSGVTANSQSSNLTISMDLAFADEISFNSKVSSEPSYDYLQFFVDGNKLGEWSGEEAWANHTYPVAAGSHVIKWTYIKDSYSSAGSDCAWIDNIIFPSTTTIIGINNIVENDDFKVYPNPNNGQFYISSKSLNSNTKIRVFDVSGRNILSQEVSVINGLVNLQLNNPQKGLYFIEICSENTKQVKKFVIR